MRNLLLALLATASLSLVACQSDMTGNPRTPEALSAASASSHPDVPHGDAYFETMISRYDLTK